MQVVIVGNANIEFEVIDGVAMTSSLNVSKVFDKKHKVVLEAIEKDSAFDEFLTGQKILLSEYRDKSGKKNKMYLLDRDAFAYFVMGFTGERAKGWKLNYIKAFNIMEQKLRNSNLSASVKPKPERLSFNEYLQEKLESKDKEIDTLKDELLEQLKIANSLLLEKVQNGRAKRRTWSKEEELKLIELYNKGLSYSQIAQKLNRTASMVSSRASVLKKRGEIK